MSEFRTRRRGSPRQRGLRFPVDKASEAGQRQVQARERYLATLLKEGSTVIEKKALEKALEASPYRAGWGAKIISIGQYIAVIETKSPRSTYLLSVALKEQGYKTRVLGRNHLEVRCDGP